MRVSSTLKPGKKTAGSDLTRANSGCVACSVQQLAKVQLDEVPVLSSQVSEEPWRRC